MSSRVNAAAIGVQAVGSAELLAWFNTGLSSSDGVNEFAVLVGRAFLDVGLRVLAVTTDLAGASGPGADGACCTFGLRSELGAGAHTLAIVAVPSAVVVVGAGLGRVVVKLRARKSAGAFEGPFALSGLAVGLDTVHGAFLGADVGCVVVVAPADAGEAIVLAETRGADLSNAGLVGAVPLAFGVKCASDIVGPLARSVQALSESGVPLAAGVACAGRRVGGEAERGATRAGLGEPFALGIVVAGLADAVAEGASGHASVVGLELTFGVLLAVSGSENFAGAAAGLELSNPLAVSVGGTSGGVGDGAASA